MHPSYLRSPATPEAKYLCNTPFCYSCPLLLLHTRWWDKAPSPEYGIAALNCLRLSIRRVPEAVHHSIHRLRHRAGLVGVLHGWVGMQTASRPSPASDPAPGPLPACNTVVPTQGARGGDGGRAGWSGRPKTAPSGSSSPSAESVLSDNH